MSLAQIYERKRVVLLRHAEVSYFDQRGALVDPRTVRLTRAGLLQAGAAAEMLACCAFDRAVCSSAPRTGETAAIVLRNRNTRLEHIHDLREIRGGRFDDIPQEDVERVIGRAFERATEDGEQFIGGERFADFERRILTSFSNWLLSTLGSEVLLAVLHEGVNRLLLSWVMTDSRTAMAALEQDYGCVNIVDFDVADGNLVRKLVRTVNVTPSDLPKEFRSATGMEELCDAYKKGRFIGPSLTPGI